MNITRITQNNTLYTQNAQNRFGCAACAAAATPIVAGVAGLTSASLNKSSAAVATGISTAMGGFTGAFLYSLSVLGGLAAPIALLGGAVTSALTAWSILNTQNHTPQK